MQTRTQTAIGARFAQLLERITPDIAEVKVFEQHQSSIEARLRSVFQANRVERIGSYTRGSAIRWTSDIDLLLILKRDEVRWGDQYKSSNTILNNVRHQLQDRYVRTDVGRDGQAVVTAFNDGQHPVDVVPGFYAGPADNGYPMFYIPDGSGGWMKTAPQLHNKFIADADTRSLGKLKNVARLVKFWAARRAHSQSLSGFHVELLLAQEAICVGAKTYAECVTDALQLLCQRTCRALQDPKGISGYVKAAGTESKRLLLYEAVQNSSGNAALALDAESRLNTQESIRRWNMVFNDSFPK